MPQTAPERPASEEPDLIHVSVTHYEEIFADRADLYVSIRGAAIGGETTALTKMQEVKQLVTALIEYGLKQTDIRLQDVYAKVATGFLGKASSASYSLKIHCADLEKLVEIFGIVAGQRNTKLEHIEWGYSVDSDLEDGGLRDKWLDACLGRANAKAARIASALGVSLLGIRRFTDTYLGGKEYAQAPRTSLAQSARMSMDFDAPGEAAMAVSHSKWITVRVEVDYRVSGRISTEKAV